MNRRNLIKGVGLGVATGVFGIASKTDEVIASTYVLVNHKWDQVTIRLSF